MLAIQRSDLHLEHGCSSAIHYATRVLGMKAKEARQLRYVASRLGDLPGLTQLAARGEIEWSKLREVVRVASPETEAVWLDLCMNLSYAQISPGEKVINGALVWGQVCQSR